MDLYISFDRLTYTELMYQYIYCMYFDLNPHILNHIVSNPIICNVIYHHLTLQITFSVGPSLLQIPYLNPSTTPSLSPNAKPHLLTLGNKHAGQKRKGAGLPRQNRNSRIWNREIPALSDRLSFFRHHQQLPQFQKKRPSIRENEMSLQRMFLSLESWKTQTQDLPEFLYAEPDQDWKRDFRTVQIRRTGVAWDSYHHVDGGGCAAHYRGECGRSGPSASLAARGWGIFAERADT